MIEERNWFTFGLEWFGDKYMEVDAKLIEEILSKTKSAENNSMGV